MNSGNIIVVLLIAALVWLVIGIMRSRRRAWEEREAKAKVRAEAKAKVEADLHRAMAESLAVNMMAPAILAAKRAQAQADVNVAAARVAHAQAQAQAKENARQHEALKATAYYDAMNDCWKDRTGKVVPDPRPVFQRMAAADRAFFNPDSFGIKITDPRKVGASISTVGKDDDEQEARRRRAVESAMMDAYLTGLGVVQMGSGGSVEHIPSETFRGSGGSFDGGGASGDYTRSEPCSSPSPSASSDSSSSCSSSSSDSGGGSGGSSD